MLDYRQMEALAAVAEEGGFDRAARRLHITQSAVSQRLRALEDTVGQALVVRTVPARPTEAGRQLLIHFQRVRQLESDILIGLRDGADSAPAAPPTLRVAVNEDSLATWFLPVLRPFMEHHAVLLDIHAEDQERTHALLRNGDVAGCVTTRPNPIQGCRCVYLGAMEYRCAASPGFFNRWFADGITAEGIRCAPAVTFNRNDLLHVRFAQRFGVRSGEFQTHYVPSSEAFVALVEMGLAYGMVPHPQLLPMLQRGTLCELAPEHPVTVHLYWHQWNLGTALLTTLTETLVAGCARILLRRMPD